MKERQKVRIVRGKVQWLRLIIKDLLWRRMRMLEDQEDEEGQEEELELIWTGLLELVLERRMLQVWSTG